MHGYALMCNAHCKSINNTINRYNFWNKSSENNEGIFYFIYGAWCTSIWNKNDKKYQILADIINDLTIFDLLMSVDDGIFIITNSHCIIKTVIRSEIEKHSQSILLDL